MFYSEDIVSESESRDILTQIPFNLITESISEQVKDPISVSTDYLDIILTKVDLALEDATEDDAATIRYELSEFLTTVIAQINESFDLGVDFNALNSDIEIRELAECLYEFYVRYYRTNLSTFITNYIYEHKKDLAALFDAEKVDVSSLRWKKLMGDNNLDVVILSNLPHIVTYIIDLDIEPEEMLRLASEDDDYSPSYIRQKIFEGIMLGGSVRTFASKCLDEHDYIIGEIETDIKISLPRQASVELSESEEE